MVDFGRSVVCSKVAKKKVKKRKKEEAKKVVAGKKGKKKGSVANGKEKEKKERKVFDLPGQKHDPPEEVLSPSQCRLVVFCLFIYFIENSIAGF